MQGGKFNTLEKMDIWERKRAKDIKAALAVLKDVKLPSRTKPALEC